MQDGTLPPGDLGAETDEDRIDFVPYLRVVRQQVGLILVCGVLFAVTAGVSRLMTAPSYEATARLLVVPPKFGTAGGEGSTPAITMITYQQLIRNRALAAKLIHEFKLQEPPIGLTPGLFLTNNLTITILRDTNLIEVSARMPSGPLAEKVANRYAELGVELAQQLSQEETGKAQAAIKSHLDQASQRFDTAKANLMRYRERAQIEAVRKDVESRLGQRTDLQKLMVEIAGERAKLASAQEQMKQRRLIGTLTRRVESDPSLAEAAREQAQASSVLNLQTRSEYLNEVYQDIDRDVAEISSKVAGLERQKAELAGVLHLDSSQLKILNDLYQREAELERLNLEYDLAKKAYSDVSSRYEDARIQVAAKTSQLMVLDPAIEPGSPTSRQVVQGASVAGTAGLLLGAAVALLLHVLRRRSPGSHQRNRAVAPPLS